jgi:alkylation response protein AidB-like acyl-CoA dehydrogenase
MAASSGAMRCVGGASFLVADVTAEEVFTPEDLSPAQLMFGRVAEDFMRTEALPRDQRMCAKDYAATRELLQKAGELDLLRVDIPEAYGGLGLDKVSAAYVRGKIGVNLSLATIFGAQTKIGILPIVYFGTEAQKARYLPDLSSGKKVAAYALTEPGSGSDALAARTKASLSADGTHYILNGQKMWITNGGLADVFTIFAKVDGDKFTAFIVEREMGVVSGREEPKMGMDGSSTTALILDNVRVPVENVLGEIGKGHKVALNILNLGRLGLGTVNLTAAKESLNGAAQYALQRQQFGRAIADFGMIKHKIGEMAVRCYVGEAMAYRTLGALDSALAAIPEEDTARVRKAIESFALECSINKVWISEALAYVVDEALQIHGGYGFSKEYPAERYYRDARINRIWEGTSEINRLLIATRLLKDPATAALVSGASLPAIPMSHDTSFPSEYNLLSAAKNLVLLMLGRAKAAYGDGLSEQQELLGHIADVAMEVYALESAIVRTRKTLAARGESSSAIPVDMTRVYASDAADRIEHWAKQVLSGLAECGNTGALAEMIQQVAGHATVNTIAARRRIANTVLKAGRYPF